MRSSSKEKYQKALGLRLNGKSYREIYRLLGTPKSTLSVWFKNLELPLKAKRLLKKKGRTPRKQLMEFNRRRTLLIKSENESIQKKSFNEIRKLSKRELMLVGAALYWGEGYRIEIQKRTPSICFSNSDPRMIVLFLRFLREVLMVPEDKLRAKLHIYGNIDSRNAVEFWSKITSISNERFLVYSIVSRVSKGKRSKNFLPVGTIEIIVCDRRRAFKIKGWIDGLACQVAAV